MPRKQLNRRRPMQGRSTKKLEQEILGHQERYVETAMPVNSRDVTRSARDRLKKVHTRTAVRAHTDMALSRWGVFDSPRDSELFWARSENELYKFYIPNYASELAVAAFCVVEDLATKKPNIKVGEVFDPLRQASARLVTELLVEVCGDVETVRQLEQPAPTDFVVCTVSSSWDHDSWRYRETLTINTPDRRFTDYGPESLRAFATTLSPMSYKELGSDQVYGTRTV